MIRYFLIGFIHTLAVITISYYVGIVFKHSLGLRPEPVSFAGGSMYPTLPKVSLGTNAMFPYPNGMVLFGKNFLGHEIVRGDIVSVENETIREKNKVMTGDNAGWVKRVIAIGGETIELREGIVYINGTALSEPYVAKQWSTFGQSSIPECTKITVPEGNIVIMGDNRKESIDSREIGFISLSSVNHVLPYHISGTMSQEIDKTQKISLDKKEYLQLLNQKRKNAGLDGITYSSNLEKSAEKRGLAMLTFNDFSFDATKSGYTVSKSLKEAGYTNIRWGEAPIIGYYEAEELLANQFAFPDPEKFLLEPAFTEIGIAEVDGQINGCPTHVVVQHFAGHISQTDYKNVIQTWRVTLAQLKKDQKIYANNERIQEIIALRIKNLTEIIKKSESYQRLTPAEQMMADNDEKLAQEQERLIGNY